MEFIKSAVIQAASRIKLGKSLRCCVCSLAAIAMLSGCARDRIVVPGSDPASVELAEAAYSLNRSMQALAETDLAEPLKIKQHAINPSAYGMGRLASVDWNGPAEPLIRKIAALTHYRVKVYGKASALPVLVSVSEREQYIGDVLRQVSLQSRDYLKLLVYPSSKLIEIHYLTN